MKRIICMIFALAILICPAAVFAENAEFSENGTFKILIIADAQDTDNPQQATLELINASLSKAQPDMVVFLGDMLHYMFIGKDETRTKEAIRRIVEPVEKRGIPFAIVFGNHDDEGGVSKEVQLEYYKSFEGCMVPGNIIDNELYYNILINGRDGKPAFNLWFFDSGTYDDTGSSKYGYASRKQIAWYEKTSAELGGLPSFAFQHIVVPEIYETLIETEDGIKGFSSHSDKRFAADPRYFKNDGLIEAPCPADFNSGQFDSWLKTGDIKAAFFGHDHKNYFEVNYKGIDLTAVPGTTFYIYGNGSKHGTRLVTLNEDLTYTTELLFYEDIVSYPLPGKLVSHLGAMVTGIITAAAAAVIIIAVCAVFIIRGAVKKRRKKRPEHGLSN